MRKIERVQYDGAGEWLDVVFDDGRRARLSAALVYELAGVVMERENEKETNDDGRVN